jgi:hypothetical protein
MDGMWEGHSEDYVVEFALFPAIIVESDERAYTKAQVIARPKKNCLKMKGRTIKFSISGKFVNMFYL